MGKNRATAGIGKSGKDEPALMLRIIEIKPDRLKEYDLIPQRVEVKSILQVELVNGGLGGILLHEILVERPYIKDYDTVDDQPSDLPKEFDVRNWVFFLSMDGDRPAGAATVAYDTTGVFMLEARRELSVLWDIRVHPDYRGAGIQLFRYAVEWSRIHGCKQMKIETQNVNVPACRFYQRMGCQLGEIRRYGYAARPGVADEVMLNWYYNL